MNRIYNILKKQPVAFCSVLSILINFIVESLSRHNPVEALSFIINSPLMFLFNSLIILFSYLILLVFKKRAFFVTFISTIWITCGIINCIVLGFRITPFSAVDLEILSSVSQIISVYLKTWQIVVIAVAISVAVILLGYFFVKCPKVDEKVPYFKFMSTVACFGISIAVITNVSINANAIEGNFTNITQAYEDYGFAYCFSNSIIDRGIKKPDDYSQERIDNIVSSINVNEIDNCSKPNIIIVQLESFIDLNTLKNVTFNQNPNPEFSQLYNNFSSGHLSVPAIGTGTANTEFEILTGMNHDFFASTEYPYKTVLRDTTCESIAYYLKDNNYSTHAIHNNDATFYGRNIVYSNLGFDTFTPLEYMQNVKYNAIGWAKDEVLTNEIMKAIESTDKRDLVFTVSVQPHGSYPDEIIDNSQTIISTGYNEDKQIALDYYANQVNDTDKFIKDLVTAVNSLDEPTVVVFYGDHIPTLGFTDDDFDGSTTFQTEYAIYSNFYMQKQSKDMEAYQLTAYLLDRLNIKGGIITDFHTDKAESESYDDDLHNLQYDMLYGEKYCYNGKIPYLPANMSFGIDKIKLRKCIIKDDTLYVYGDNFTAFSMVTVNGENIETKYINKSVIAVPADKIVKGDIISVAQLSKKGTVIEYTNELTIE